MYKRQVSRRAALAVLKKLLASATKVVRAGSMPQLPATELVPGDVILLEVGEPCAEPEPMPARNTLLAGTSLVSGEAKGLEFATGSHSALRKIALLDFRGWTQSTQGCRVWQNSGKNH